MATLPEWLNEQPRLVRWQFTEINRFVKRHQRAHDWPPEVAEAAILASLLRTEYAYADHHGQAAEWMLTAAHTLDHHVSEQTGWTSAIIDMLADRLASGE